jgi:hypothetical protein
MLLTALVILDQVRIDFISKTPHLAPCFRIDSICTSKYIAQIRSPIFAYDCNAACVLTYCCEVLAQQNLGLVLEVVVKYLEDVLSITECERVTTPVGMVSRGLLKVGK